MPKDKEVEELVALENLRHKNRMEEIEIETNGKREFENLKFDHQMQLQRIKTAEIRKAVERREQTRFLGDKI